MKRNFLQLFKYKTFAIKIDLKNIKDVKQFKDMYQQSSVNDCLFPSLVLNSVFINPTSKYEDKVEKAENISAKIRKTKP